MSLLGCVSRILQSILWVFFVIVVVVGCRSQTRETFDLGQAKVVPLDSSVAFDASSAKRLAVPSRLRQMQILIAQPAALKALDGDNIIISNGGGSIFYLNAAQLSDRLPPLVQSRLVQAFEDSGIFGGVGRPGDGLAVHYQLLSDIREFAIEAHTRPQQARIEISLKIIDDRRGSVRAARVFSQRQPVMGKGNSAYAQALERAFSLLLTDIVNWTVNQL